MNILTIDIEEWYLEKMYFGNHLERYLELDENLERLLMFLEERRIKGTFFCVGGMATDFPHVVRRIESHGHEIGCHSFRHTWLNKMSRKEIEEDTRMAIDALEQCIGKKIKSYRAPAFSIGQSNNWVFKILVKNGIEYDASVFPVDRDFGGYSQFRYKVPLSFSYQDSVIKEFPICTIPFLGKELAYSGGGYFRLFPLWFIKKEVMKSNYSMTYFHLNDFIPRKTQITSKEGFESYFKESGTPKNRYMRYVKSKIGKKNAFNKFQKLMCSVDFINIEEANRLIEWDKQPILKL